MAMNRLFVKTNTLLVLAYVAFAQQPLQPVHTGFLELDRHRVSRLASCADDYGEIVHYRSASATVKRPAHGQLRVVFFGDSITDLWRLDDSFPGKPYINRGISGQTTSQMLVRFRQDVINLQPKAVVLLAGTNDIAGNTGRIANEDIEANLASMAELARIHKIGVIFSSSILPVHNYTPESKEPFAERPPHRILALNKWLKSYCSNNRFIYLDYFSAMVDGKGLLQRDLADDGLHPNKAGYAIMAPSQIARSKLASEAQTSALLVEAWEARI